MLPSGAERVSRQIFQDFLLFSVPRESEIICGSSSRFSAGLSLGKVCAHDRQKRGRPFRALLVLSVSIVLKRGELFSLEEIGLPFTAKYHKIDRILYNRFCFFI